MGKSKIITYVVVAVLVLVGIYWVYGLINKAPETATGVVAVPNSGGVVANDQTSQFVSVLNEIDNIDLQDRSIFSNKIFTSLKDFGKPIEDRAIGRANPFAPFAGGSGTIANPAGGNAGTGSSTDQGGSGNQL
ncbi:MAG: hypothetical protein WC640_02940 [Candidatus Paceibacterota bacterium]|jgi:hypothetical protein